MKFENKYGTYFVDALTSRRFVSLRASAVRAAGEVAHLRLGIAEGGAAASGWRLRQRATINLRDDFVWAQGERYSFVMIYADDANGTGELMRRAHQLPLGELHSSLQQRHVQISIPPFEFNSVTYLKDSLKSVRRRRYSYIHRNLHVNYNIRYGTRITYIMGT